MQRIAWKLLVVSIVLVAIGVSFQLSHAGHDLIDVKSPGITASRAAHLQTSDLVRITSVSPDRPWGEPPGTRNQDPGGQVDAIAIDPNNERVIYAASETAGVWKSTDTARSWEWSGKGLRNGATIIDGPALAIDDRASSRLLYATQNDDFRLNHPDGGLYVSTDAAATWNHVDLPGCLRPSIRAVAFSAGRGVVGTRCGVFVSRDLLTWHNSTPTNSSTLVAASGPNVYACSGSLTWQSKEPTSTNLSWTPGPQLVGRCSALTAAPDEPDKKLLVVYSDPPPTPPSTPPSNRMTVGIVDYSQRPAGFIPLPATVIFRTEGSGVPILVAARRPSVPAGGGPGRSYDLFLANGFHFFQFRPGTPSRPGAPPELVPAWIRLPTFHVDTHAFAVAPSYDPERRRCVAYAATDGGVFATESCGTSPQALTNARWFRAMHGLHAFGTYAIAGFSQSNCASPPCPALYVSSNDNGMWGTLSGGKLWRPMRGCCGDNGDALVDAGLPEREPKQVATFRPNGGGNVFRSSDKRPPISEINVADGYPIDINFPMMRRGIIQIQTPAGQNARSKVSYLAIRRTATRDTIVRNMDPEPGRTGNWVDIAPSNPFPQGSVVAVQASNGHIRPTVYVLTFGSRLSTTMKGVWKGTVSSSGTVRRADWQLMSNGLNNAINLFVNPYDPNHLYVSDIGDRAIKSSRDGGQTWQSEPVLTRIATRNGHFLFDCGRIDNYVENWYAGVSEVHRYACPLNAMVFVRDRPEIRVAVLHPGGVAFSRDSGANWIELQVTELIDTPFGAFYDTEINPETNTPSLYIALRGRGVIRVDAPFNTLSSLSFELRGLPEAGTRSVVAVNDTTGKVTPLSRGEDGVFRGTELFDAAVPPSAHVYRYVINNQLQSSRFQRTIKSGEMASGVVTVTDDVRHEGLASLESRRDRLP